MNREGAQDHEGDLAVEVTAADHALGEESAPVTLVEYGDYECGACLNAFPMVRELRERSGGRLRFVFRHFPQHAIHPHAGVAAQAAEAAAMQGKFWEMHEALFRNQDRLGEVDFGHLALGAGVELYRFQAELGGERARHRVAQHREGGERSGVRRTPTFFINGRRYEGPVDVESLSAAIEKAAG